jgi:hypothetical protein
MPDSKYAPSSNPEVQSAPPSINAAPAGQRLPGRVFPWLASVLVVIGNILAAWRIDAEVAAGRFTGLPYLALFSLFIAVLAAHHYLSRGK